MRGSLVTEDDDDAADGEGFTEGFPLGLGLLFGVGTAFNMF